MNIITAIEQLIDRKHLTQDQSYTVCSSILQQADPCQIAALLVLLRTHGETADEICGMVQALREVMLAIDLDYPVLDIVGTGGDGANTVNISTASSILAASCGVKVAKHGSRAVSSKSGSSNVLQALQIDTDMDAQQIKACLQQVGIAYCFAPRFHPAYAKVKAVRQALGVRTVFNILGPLLNPANAQHILLGVFDAHLVPLLAQVLCQLGVKHAMVVHACGLDELNCLGPAKVVEIIAGECRPYQLDPQDYGFDYCQLTELQGGDAQHNAKRIQAVFQGECSALADTIVLNAGVGVYLADQVASIAEGIALATQQLRRGGAAEKLAQWVSYSTLQDIADA